MSQFSKSPDFMEDERLADFTDRVMTGKAKRADEDADGEILALEETVLRLNRAFPSAPLERAAAKQMQARFKARLKREAQSERQPFWRKWLAPQPRLQFAMALAAIAAAFLVFAVFNPAAPGSSASATALKPAGGAFALLALAAVLFVIFWILRRK